MTICRISLCWNCPSTTSVIFQTIVYFICIETYGCYLSFTLRSRPRESIISGTIKTITIPQIIRRHTLRPFLKIQFMSRHGYEMSTKEKLKLPTGFP